LNIGNILTCMMFFPKKIAFTILKAGHFKAGKRLGISLSASIRIKGKQALVKMGNHVFIRPNTELHADNGKINLGDNVFINRNCMIVSHKSILIGAGTSIGPGTIIYDHDHNFKGNLEDSEKEVVIDSNVWIGGNCSILKGVHIGTESIVAAGSVVTKDVEPYTIWGGVPAKKIKDRFSPETLKEHIAIIENEKA
jgi:Acetyltransferase (isoleucine patch superfamily)